MYGQFYGLAREPFGLSPDVRFCYRHPSFKRGKAYLQYALMRGEGFVIITGRPGSGKTTLVQDLLSDLQDSRLAIARIDTTQVGADDLLRLVVHYFGIRTQGSDKSSLLIGLESFLMGQAELGGKGVLIVDEAQNLSAGALEELRLITNLQSGAYPLIQVVLVGQEALRGLLSHPELEQLHQRIIAAHHLDPLDLAETRSYIRHRLLQAGWSGDPSITGEALRGIHKASRGVPRLINKVCDRLLLYGSLEEKHALGIDDVQLVLDELLAEAIDPIGDPDSNVLDETPQGDTSDEVADLTAEVEEQAAMDVSATAARSGGERFAAPVAATSGGQPLGEHSVANVEPGDASPGTERTTAAGSGASGEDADRQAASAAADHRTIAASLGSAGGVDHARAPSVEPWSTQPDRAVGSTEPVAIGHGSGSAAKAQPDASSLSPAGRPDSGSETRVPRPRPIGRKLALAAVVMLGVGSLGYLLYLRGVDRVIADIEAGGTAALSQVGAWLDRISSFAGRRPADGAMAPSQPPDAQAATEAHQPAQLPTNQLAKPEPTGSPPSSRGEEVPPYSQADSEADDVMGAVAAAGDARSTGLHSSMELPPVGGPAPSAAVFSDGGVTDVPPSEPVPPAKGDAADPTPAPGDSSLAASGAALETSDTADAEERPKIAAETSEGADTDESRVTKAPDALDAPSPLAAESDRARPALSTELIPPANLPRAEILGSVSSEVASASDDLVPDEGPSDPGDMAAAADASGPTKPVPEPLTLEDALRKGGFEPARDPSGRLALSLHEELRFPVDGAEIPPESHALLGNLAKVLAAYPGTSVTIIGYTDASGPREYNRVLSLRRARAVETFLREQGLAGERLSSIGRGEDEPIVQGPEGEAGALARLARRRIEIVLENKL